VGRQPTGTHEFDPLCEVLGSEHRLTKPRTPQTNGMVERFNARISDILKTHHCLFGENLAETLRRLRLPVQQSTAPIGFGQSDDRPNDA